MQYNKLARQNYLQAEVQTATPQKLQLMLVEAAIKNVRRTKKAWEEERFEAGLDSLTLAQDIVAEILSSVDKEGNPDLAGKIASIYVFIFRCIAEAGMSHDQQKLDDALRVLNSERETWRQVCEHFGSTVAQPGDASGTGYSSAVSSSAKLDLSTDSAMKSSVPNLNLANPAAPKPSEISTASFGRPPMKPIEPPQTPPSTGTSSRMSWDV